MRSRHLNFALAIAISAAAHLLLWPAAVHITVPKWSFEGEPNGHHGGEVTLLLQDEPEKPPAKEVLPKLKKSPEVEPPDEMGESTGKGTGAQAAKGDKPMKAPEADQDQAFLSRDPVGMGRIGDPPTFFTGPRGENGSGGQVGGSQAAPNPAHSPSADERVAMHEPERETQTASGQKQDRPPRESPVHIPEPEVPSVTPPKDVAPPPAKMAVVGAAPVDVNQPTADPVKATGPLAQVVTAADDGFQLSPNEGPPAAAVPGSSTAPPARPDAPADRAAIALAPQLPVPIAPVLTIPLPAVEVALPKPKDPTPPKPTVAMAAPTPPAPAIVTTGDGRAPGQDRASADPAQESDSESDPFSKTMSADVLHDGRLDVRQGRKVKTTRPHFLPGAEAAQYANRDASVVLEIAIDERGNVIPPVNIIKSSGSVELDQPCRVAVYDWWFEPTHNKAGKPVKDVVVFTIRFR